MTEFDGSSTNTYTYTYYGTTETVKTVKRNGSMVTTYTYDALERLTGKTTTCTRSNGTTYTVSSESYAYRNGQTWSQTTPFVSAVTIGDGRVFEYTYDNAGNITTVKENGVQKVSYAYDKLGQLTRENNAYLGKTYTYTYDMIGNRTAKKTYAYTTAAALGTAQSTWSYTNIRDQLTKVNNIAITYDAAGNPTKWYDIESLTWTGTQLTTMVFGVGPVASYAYNDNGQRTKRSVGFRSTLMNYEYHYDANGRLVYETIKTAGGRNDKITYIYDASGGLAGLAYKDTPGAVYTYFYERNGQGEIIGLRNDAGARVVEYAYDAWGDCTTVSDTTLEKIGTLNPFRYKDYYYDWETGWYYLNARYYDPDVGRFLNADSVEYLGADGSPLSYNRYVYCGNNPVMYADPSGHLFGLITIGVLAFMFTPIGGTVAQAAVSTVSYAGMAVASIWDEDIRADMNAIGWNPFNTNESAVLGSNKVSFYKGMPVFRTNGGRSGTFYAIALKRDADAVELRHERGHGWQSMMMGIGTYAITVGIPSPLKLGPWAADKKYYAAPWETMADVLGGARAHSSEEISRAWTYYKASMICPPLAMFWWFQ